MRKLLTSFLTLALAFSINTAAFATNADTNMITNDGSEDTSITVNATYRDSSTDVISVDIAWDRMDFTYTAEGLWDPETHSVSSSGTGTWSWNGAADGNSTPTITVTNHSNTGVKAQFEFTPAVSGLVGSFTGLTDGALTLATAEKTTPANAPSKSTSFSISGSGISENKSSLGTITVNVSKNDTDSDDDGVIKVSTVQELMDAIEFVDNQYVKLESNITLNDILVIHGDDVGDGNVIDLNGHTISCSDELLLREVPKINILSFHESLLTIKNGTLKTPFRSKQSEPGILFSYEGSTRFEDCTFIGLKADIAHLDNSTVTFHNCSFSLSEDNYLMTVSQGAHLIFSGDTRSNRGTRTGFISHDPQATITCLAGTYNFDPTPYVDTSDFTVTNDGTIWTVTEN